MDAIFVDIIDVFKENNLQFPKLDTLVPDNCLYETFAIQPSGKIEVSDSFIGHEDREMARSKFSDFLSLAADRACDLVLSPEYSFPWEVLSEAIENNTLPNPGKLWILGCCLMIPSCR